MAVRTDPLAGVSSEERALHYIARLRAHGHNPAAAKSIATEMMGDPVLTARHVQQIAHAVTGKGAKNTRQALEYIAGGRPRLYQAKVDREEILPPVNPPENPPLALPVMADPLLRSGFNQAQIAAMR